MCAPLLPALSANHRVIAVDLQAHGRTADIERPMRLELMADDVAALIRQLGLDKADVMGYSLGGGVALQTAIRHPDRVRKLVLVSTPFRRDGWYPEVLAGMAQVGPQAAEPMKQTPLYALYASLAPRPEDWPVLLAKLGELLQRDYDWTAEVKALPMPVLLVAGDADALRLAHVVEFFGLLGGGQRDAGWDGSRRNPRGAQLAVLPGATHYDIFARPELASTALQFLDAPK
jgi:pimeloyl-ACP methyl ester carboxylesterase